MRFFIVASALAALASAQSSSSGSATSQQSATSTTAKTPTETCLGNCKAGDTYCQAACLGTAHANGGIMGQTTDCVAKCDQGDGTKADNDAYAKCRDTCLSSFINTSTLATLTSGAEGPTQVTVIAGTSSAAGAASSGSSAAAGAASSGSSAASSGGSAVTSAASSARNSASSAASSASSGASSAGSSASSSASAASASSSGAAMNVQAGTIGGVAGLLLAGVALL